MRNEHIILARRPSSNGLLWRHKACSENGFKKSYCEYVIGFNRLRIRWSGGLI
jgi:hypothetical protein